MGSHTGKIFIIIGSVCIIAGLICTLAAHLKIPLFFGRLPGDIVIKKRDFVMYLPITTSIILSILLSIIFSFLRK